MSVIIGSARGDEKGHATGGEAGDQKQKQIPDYKGEVSRQEWYPHGKGWTLIRFHDAEVREKIARDMEYACDNPYVGYDQGENESLREAAKPYGYDISKVKKPCETDCARLVRVCVLYAGIDCEVFYTGDEAKVLQRTGQCMVSNAKKYTESSKYLLRGDILVTKTKGHTVVVLSNRSGKKGRTCSDAVKDFQKFLNNEYEDVISERLKVDGEYGPKTRAAAVAVYKYMANKYYGTHLTVGNPDFYSQCRNVGYLMTDEQIAKHPTLGYLVQGVLAGRSYYKGVMNGKITQETVNAVKEFQTDVGLSASGCVTGSTWYKLYN